MVQFCTMRFAAKTPLTHLLTAFLRGKSPWNMTAVALSEDVKKNQHLLPETSEAHLQECLQYLAWVRDEAQQSIWALSVALKEEHTTSEYRLAELTGSSRTTVRKKLTSRRIREHYRHLKAVK